MNLLIVEDDPVSRRRLRAALEAEGHESVEAANGLEALQTLEHVTFDAVISDILMPTMDGFRLCHEIRRSRRLGSHLPVVLYTAAYDSPSDQQLGKMAGADAYLAKPAPVSAILAAVCEAQLRVRTPQVDQLPALNESCELEQYNAALVRKLERRNGELREALDALRASREQILALNRLLEIRVTQRTAALEGAIEDLEALCQSLSYDFRIPLRNIICRAQVLEEAVHRQFGGEGLKRLAQIAQAARQIDLFIEGLLEFARTSPRDLMYVELDLEEILEEALRIVAAEVVSRQIEWRRSRLPQVQGDPISLRQVLINLLSNAIKYTRTRHRAIIEVGTRPGRVDEVVVFVRDNGIGFDSRSAGAPFEPFRRLQGAHQLDGMGIGLANAQRIITRHGGKIWADAAVNRGATFFFNLPSSRMT